MASSKLTIGDLLFRLGYENDDKFIADLEKVLGKAEKEVEKSGGDAGKAGGKAAGRGFTEQFKATFGGAALGSFLGSALAGAFSGAIAAAQKFAIDSVREFAVYEQGLLQLQLAGETNLSALSKRIQDTAKATKVFSATDVSLAVGDLVKAGYDAETAFALVEAGALGAASEVDAASGKFGDLAGTAGSLGNILRALGYDTSQSARVMDVLARAAQDSNLDVSDLVDIVSRVGPTAKLAGLEIEDLAAQAAVLSNNGMEASLIGTGLRSVLQSLINPSGAVKGELDKLGISLVDSNGNLRDFNDVLDGLHELTERGGEGLQILTAATGSYGSTAAASLGAASETVKEFRASMDGAEGSAQELADTMRNSAAGAAAEMAARIKDAKAALGEQLMPILLSLNESVFPTMIGWLGGLIQKWTDWEFILTGTTTALREQNAEYEKTVVAGMGQEWFDAWKKRQGILTRIGELEGQLANWDRSTDWFGLGKGRAEAELADLRFQLAGVNAELTALNNQREQARRIGSWEGGDGQPFGPLPPGVTREQAEAAVAAVVESYRNLAAVEAELAAERERFAAAATAEEEAQSAARIKVLEAEVAAKKGLYATAQQAAKSAGVTRDPLVDEAQRVQNDLQRLKLAYEQGELSLEDYVGAQEAHLRRLDGLYERVVSPEQSLAVLRARKALLDELARLDEAAADPADAAKTWVARLEAELRFGLKNAADVINLLSPRLEELRQEAGAALSEFGVDSQQYADAIAKLEVVEATLKRVAKSAQLSVEPIGQVAAELRDLTVDPSAVVNLDGLRSIADIEKELSTARAAVRAAATDEARVEALLVVELLEEELKRVKNGIALSVEPVAKIVGELRDLVADPSAVVAAAHELSVTPFARVADFQTIERLENELRAAQQAVNTAVGVEAQRAAQLIVMELEAELARARAAIVPRALSVAPTVTFAGQDYSTWQRDQEAAADAVQAQARQIAGDLMGVAEGFPRALIEGIQGGDISGALRNALGDASDYFLDQMLQAILGPITKELTASIAASLAAQSTTGAAGAATGALGALGPTGLVLGGLALVASMLIGSQQRKQIAERPATAAKAAVSGAPSVTYNLTGNVTVTSNASWSDPAFQARWRSETEALLVSLLGKVRR